MIPHLSRLPLPTDTSSYLLVGSASGASCSIVATINQIPSATWLGALLALASLAGNLWIEREKTRRGAEADRIRKESEERTQAAIRDLNRAVLALTDGAEPGS